jgi:3-keto-disaccharide hydrolase
MYHRVVARGAIAAALGVSLAACARTPQSSEQRPAGVQSTAQGEASVSVVTPQEQAAGWRPLFDGKSTAGWRGYKKAEMPRGWEVVDGALTRVGQGGDIITNDQFGNFELVLEWNVAPGGNSGIFYRVTEEGQATYETGPELQVLDDARHVDGHSRLTAAGSLYGIYAAPPGVVKSAGEWNAVRIVVNGNHVEHWLNGVKVVDYELGSPDWEKLVAGSKFKEWPGYGRATRGHIALQDHGDRVAFRNIKIKVLP